MAFLPFQDRASVKRNLGGAARCLFAFCFLLCLFPAFAAELPRLTGRVVDDAGMLDGATLSALDQKLAAFEQKSSDQIVVATVPSLDGDEIEPYANRLFRAWGLGQAGENNGILLLVARDDRKMRIEVGYGLEGTLTDLHSKLIIEDTMVPAFRAGDSNRGITGAVDDIIRVLEGQGSELEARRARNAEAEKEERLSKVPMLLITFGTITLFIMFVAFLAGAGSSGPYTRRVTRRNSRGQRTVWTTNSGSVWGSGSGWSSGSGSWSSGSSSGGFSGGGGSSGGGGASGSW